MLSRNIKITQRNRLVEETVFISNDLEILFHSSHAPLQIFRSFFEGGEEAVSQFSPSFPPLI